MMTTAADARQIARDRIAHARAKGRSLDSLTHTFEGSGGPDRPTIQINGYLWEGERRVKIRADQIGVQFGATGRVHVFSIVDLWREIEAGIEPAAQLELAL